MAQELNLKHVNVSITTKWAGHWWCMPLITALGRQRQPDLWVRSQPGLHSELQDSQGYTREAYLGKRNLSQKKKYQMSILSLPLSFQGHLKICFITICVFVCFVFACMCTCVYLCIMVHWSKRSTFRSRFPPSTMWVLRWNSGVRSVQQVSLSLGSLTGSTGPFIFLRQNIETLSRERRPSLRVLVWQPWEAAVHVIQLNQWMVPAQDHSLPHLTGPT